MVYFRYKWFPIGTNSKQNIKIAANCCVKEFQIIVTDVAGNDQTTTAYRKGSIIPLIEAIFTGIGIAILIVLIVGFLLYLRRNKQKYGQLLFEKYGKNIIKV